MVNWSTGQNVWIKHLCIEESLIQQSVVVFIQIYETQDTVHMEDKTFTRNERSEKRLRMAESDYKDIFCKNNVVSQFLKSLLILSIIS